MQTRRSLRNVIMLTGGLAAIARRAPSPGAARAQLTRRIAVPALVFVSLGATAAASPGAAHAASSCAAGKPAQAHAVAQTRPWMYGKPGAAKARACQPAPRKAGA